MKETFRDKNISKPRLALLAKVCAIIEEYQAQNIKMTLRQLYYQLVARGIIANQLKEYSKLSALLTDARYNGIVDWEAIEDRIRVPVMHAQWKDVAGLIDSAKHSYRLPRWVGQEYYIELFSEKDALSSVLAPIANKWHIHFCVNRGYTSASAMYDLSKRVKRQVIAGKKVVILYLGDHDPSGLDMVRDIQDRLNEFLQYRGDVKVKLIALTMAQVNEYNPPPNPAKITDPRARAYIEEHGNVSWEVDALRPEVMIKLVDETVQSYIDLDKMNVIIEKEKKDMEQVEDFANELVEGDSEE